VASRPSARIAELRGPRAGRRIRSGRLPHRPSRSHRGEARKRQTPARRCRGGICSWAAALRNRGRGRGRTTTTAYSLRGALRPHDWPVPSHLAVRQWAFWPQVDDLNAEKVRRSWHQRAKRRACRVVFPCHPPSSNPILCADDGQSGTPRTRAPMRRSRTHAQGAAASLANGRSPQRLPAPIEPPRRPRKGLSTFVKWAQLFRPPGFLSRRK